MTAPRDEGWWLWMHGELTHQPGLHQMLRPSLADFLYKAHRVRITRGAHSVRIPSRVPPLGVVA